MLREQMTQDKISALFEELVPASGKAESKAGEIIRAYSRIGYRFYNDGDMIGKGYGKHTCNAAARFLIEQGLDPMEKLVLKMWETYDEDKYEDYLNELAEVVLDYIIVHPELRTQPTEDMFDHSEAEDEDDYDDEWEEEEEYDEDEDDWY